MPKREVFLKEIKWDSKLLAEISKVSGTSVETIRQIVKLICPVLQEKE